MKASVLDRIAAVLLLLFAAGHTLGFSQSDPSCGVALAFAAIAVLSWRYLFVIPIAFSIAVTACLTAAAWVSGKQAVGRAQ
jgi:hypothetical protein